jgi:hypothetical protein
VGFPQLRWWQSTPTTTTTATAGFNDEGLGGARSACIGHVVAVCAAVGVHRLAAHRAAAAMRRMMMMMMMMMAEVVVSGILPAYPWKEG